MNHATDAQWDDLQNDIAERRERAKTSCLNCGAPTGKPEPKGLWRDDANHFCSESCRRDFATPRLASCVNCGKSVSNPQATYCSDTCAQEDMLYDREGFWGN